MTFAVRNRQDSISAQNSFSRVLTIKQGGVLTLEGTWVAIVSLYRIGSDGNRVPITGNTGSPVTFTTNGTYTIAPNAVASQYQWGIATGNYTSGTVVGMLEGVDNEGARYMPSGWW